MPITGSSSSKEPDLLVLNVFDNPILVAESPDPPLASIVTIELKRPMRNNAAEGTETYPIEQSLDYLGEIRKGRVKNAHCCDIPGSENIPGFCYVICDITSSIRNQCEMHDLTVTNDGIGYFAYKKNFNAYVEIFSYDR